MVRRHPVIDRQAHPTAFGEVRHQRVPLQHPAAVHPRATRHEQQYGRGFDGQLLRPPHVEQLRRVIAVAHRTAVHVAPVFERVPQRGHVLRGGPVDGQVRGGHDAAQRVLGDRMRQFPLGLADLGVPRRDPGFRGCGEEVGHVPEAPYAHRGHGAQRFQVLADDWQRSRRDAPCQHVVSRRGAQQPSRPAREARGGVPGIRSCRHCASVPRARHRQTTTSPTCSLRVMFSP